VKLSTTERDWFCHFHNTLNIKHLVAMVLAVATRCIRIDDDVCSASINANSGD
jgi:hypothetical protein